jgi:hypothetical protein
MTRLSSRDYGNEAHPVAAQIKIPLRGHQNFFSINPGYFFSSIQRAFFIPQGNDMQY